LIKPQLRSGKNRNIAKIIRKPGYGSIFILTGSKRPNIDSSLKAKGRQQKAERVARGRLAGYGMPYRIKYFTCTHNTR